MTRRKAAYLNGFVMVAMALILAGCGATLPEQPTEGRHITKTESPLPAKIPEIVRTPTLLAPPGPQPKLDVYSVVVNDVPVRDLLFSLSRDASLNLDIYPGINGNVTLNAVNQTLPQILSRIARQVDIRWTLSGNSLIIEPDVPYLRTYRVDYVNISRKSTGEVDVATSISTAGPTNVGNGSGAVSSGSNNSTSKLSQESDNTFWPTLVSNLRAIIGDKSETGGASTTGTKVTSSENIICNPETGLVTVRATTLQHEDIQRYLDLLQSRALRQVLIEATVVEVRLKDQYQTGVDWAMLGRNSGRYSFSQSLTGLNLASSPVSTFTIDRSSDPDALTATIKMLDQFGNLKVLSTPKLMVLNNQTAMLKVVDNKVYFTIEVTQGTPATATSAAIPPTYTSTVHTVPIGFVMAVTPQISENDDVALNVRPTISRIIGYVDDPSPALAQYNIVSQVPEVQVREVESILKVHSGQIGVLGGLMQDTLDKNTDGLPVASRLPLFGNLFSYRNDTANKTELVIFLRPAVIRQASLDGDLKQFKSQLPDPNLIPTNPIPNHLPSVPEIE